MIQFTQTLNFLLSLGTVFAQLGIVIILILIATKKNPNIVTLLKKYALHLSLTIATFGTVLSLVYSNIIGFTACTFCWWQRIFLYPQVILFGVGLWKKDKNVFNSTLVLSTIGAGTALYQYYGQMFQPSALPCAAVGTISTCAFRYFVEFGYVTLPLMSLTAFIILILLGWIGKSSQKI